MMFQLAPGIEYLLMSYPAFVSVDSIPLATVEEKVLVTLENFNIV